MNIALTEPWNIETMRWRHTLDISDRQKAVCGIELDPTVKRMWLMDTGRNEILEYHLDDPWALFRRQYSDFSTTG